MLSASARNGNRTRDAADGGAHPEMRFDLVCGTSLKTAMHGDMMELVDVSDSKSDGREVVWVRVPLSPPAPQMFE